MTAQCTNCRSPLRPGARFCTTCGTQQAAPPGGQAAPREPRPDARSGRPAGPPPSPQVQQGGTPGAAGSGSPSPRAAAGGQAEGGGVAGLARQSASWGERIWNGITVAGSAVIAGLWYWYSSLAETQPDYYTCAAIVLLPLALIVFRRPIDRALQPLQGVLGQVPPLVRLGAGLAVPFLVANYLYAQGSSNFEFMLRTVVISTVLSYVVMRAPAPQAPQGGTR